MPLASISGFTEASKRRPCMNARARTIPMPQIRVPVLQKSGSAKKSLHQPPPRLRLYRHVHQTQLRAAISASESAAPAAITATAAPVAMPVPSARAAIPAFAAHAGGHRSLCRTGGYTGLRRARRPYQPPPASPARPLAMQCIYNMIYKSVQYLEFDVCLSLVQQVKLSLGCVCV